MCLSLDLFNSLSFPLSLIFFFGFFALDSDKIIKRKLLIDGDGLGDDRRINIMLKTFLKWCSSNESDEEQ